MSSQLLNALLGGRSVSVPSQNGGESTPVDPRGIQFRPEGQQAALNSFTQTCNELYPKYSNVAASFNSFATEEMGVAYKKSYQEALNGVAQVTAETERVVKELHRIRSSLLAAKEDVGTLLRILPLAKEHTFSPEQVLGPIRTGVGSVHTAKQFQPKPPQHPNTGAVLPSVANNVFQLVFAAQALIEEIHKENVELAAEVIKLLADAAKMEYVQSRIGPDVHQNLKELGIVSSSEQATKATPQVASPKQAASPSVPTQASKTPASQPNFAASPAIRSAPHHYAPRSSAPVSTSSTSVSRSHPVASDLSQTPVSGSPSSQQRPQRRLRETPTSVVEASRGISDPEEGDHSDDAAPQKRRRHLLNGFGLLW